VSNTYVLTVIGADLTIGQRVIEVTADAQRKTYGEADPSLTYQVTDGSLAAGDAITGNLTRVDNEELARNRATGFQGDRNRGGGMSNQASRAKDETAFVNANGRYRYRPITSREVKKARPDMPRKIVGEMVIIDVQSRTATAIITRVASEVHTGDWVEIQ